MSNSKYLTMPETRKDIHPREIRCARCYGSGEDDDGADCVACEGNGTILV